MNAVTLMTADAARRAPRAPRLVVDHVRLSYGDGDGQVTALDDASVTVAAGEMVAVVGASGSGKSSLLAVTGAMRRPDSGTVTIDGVSIADAPPKRRSRMRHELIGFVFQGSNLFASLTAAAQLELVGKIGGAGRAETRRKAAELLDEVGLSAKKDRLPGHLSGGERQRVGIARALMAGPAVLLVDEPTSALDARRSADIAGLLAGETHAHGIATVLVTHDLEVARFADRILQMHDGRLMPAPAPDPVADGARDAG